MTGHVGDSRQCELGPTPLRVQRSQDEVPTFVALQDLSSAARRRIAEVGERDVTAHLTDSDDRTMGCVALDLALDLFAERVLGNEGDERQRVVHRERGGLAPLPGTVRWPLRLGFSAALSAPRARSGGPRGRGLTGGFDDFLRRHGDGLGHALFRLHRLAHHLAAPRTTNGLARAEDPSDSGHRGAAEKAATLEQPGMLAMELLERVVRKHGPIDLLRNTKQERVSASDGTGRGMDVLAAQRSLFETRKLRGVDPVRERGVDNDGYLRVRMVAPELGDSFFQLLQARQGPAFGGDVGSVDDDVLYGHVRVVKHPEPRSARHLVFEI